METTRKQHAHTEFRGDLLTIQHVRLKHLLFDARRRVESIAVVLQGLLRKEKRRVHRRSKTKI